MFFVIKKYKTGYNSTNGKFSSLDVIHRSIFEVFLSLNDNIFITRVQITHDFNICEMHNFFIKQFINLKIRICIFLLLKYYF